MRDVRKREWEKEGVNERGLREEGVGEVCVFKKDAGAKRGQMLLRGGRGKGRQREATTREQTFKRVVYLSGATSNYSVKRLFISSVSEINRCNDTDTLQADFLSTS